MKKIFTITIMSLMLIVASAQGNDYAKDGLYFDGFLGGGAFTLLEDTDYSTRVFSIGAKVGSKFYLSPENKYTYGLQVEWARIGLSVGSNNLFSTGNNTEPLIMFDLLPTNVGYASYLAFNDKMGLEINLNVGPGFEFGKNIIYAGFHVNPQSKFRYKNLAVGLDVSILNGANVKFSDSYWLSKNTFALTFGINL